MRSTHGWLPSICAKAPVDDVVVVDDQDAQPLVGRTRRALAGARSWLLEGDDEADLPAPAVAGAELEQAARLERLEAGQAQAHARPGRRRVRRRRRW